MLFHLKQSHIKEHKHFFFSRRYLICNYRWMVFGLFTSFCRGLDAFMVLTLTHDAIYIINPTHRFHNSYIQSCSYHFYVSFLLHKKIRSTSKQESQQLSLLVKSILQTFVEPGVPLAPPENLWLAEIFGSNHSMWSLWQGVFPPGHW